MTNIGNEVQAQAAAQDASEDLQPTALREIGSTGLNRSGGFIGEEYLTSLQGTNGVRAYKEMDDNDPIASGMMFGIRRVLQRLPWEIVGPTDPTPAEECATSFVQSCFDDMATPWSNVIEDILSLTTYGWSFLEMNLKLRGGPDAKEDWRRSQYSDNRLGWRSFAIRSQDTLSRWEFGDNGDLLGMTQMDPNGAGMRTIPMGKGLLFRTSTFKDNPEGKSLLRGAYRPWYYKKRIEDFEGIGVERDLAGLPIATLPMKFFSTSATADEKHTLQLMQNLVSDIRQDQNGGVVLPVAYDEHGNKMIGLDLVSSSGSKGFDTNSIIKRKSEEMAMSILMDFLMLGHQAVGSFALGTAKIDLWTMSVESVARGIAETFNKYAIAPLLKWNVMKGIRPPELVFGEVANVDIGSLGAFIEQMIGAGVFTTGPELERFARNAANIPLEAEEPSFHDAPNQ